MSTGAGSRAERMARTPARTAAPWPWTAHVVVFLIGNLGLVVLWAAEAGSPLGWDPDPYWPAWVHVLWGAGLALHRASLARGAHA